MKLSYTPNTKICTKCTKELSVSSFALYKEAKNGLQTKCKECDKKYRQEHKKEMATYLSIYNKEHKKELTNYKADWFQKNYSKIKANKNREAIRQYEKDLYRKNPNYRIAKLLRSRLKAILKGEAKTGSAIKDLGCSVEELKIHLEKQFKPGMNWEQYGKIHIDHIKPLSKFDLTDRQQFLEACHYTNLQPLWAEENLKKSDRVG